MKSLILFLIKNASHAYNKKKVSSEMRTQRKPYVRTEEDTGIYKPGSEALGKAKSVNTDHPASVL